MRSTLALSASLILTAVSVVRADVLPPQEDITEVQQMLVGTWQQTAATGLMGHGEGRTTLSFSKTDFASQTLGALPLVNVYWLDASSGTWTAEKLSGDNLKVTLKDRNGAPDQPLTIHFTGKDSFDIPIGGGQGVAVRPFKRIYP